ncbi:zinc finger protein OZF-like [Diorhabda sublineata]|uniref:zinc finger protein OZF-like n=1 Tax=Diorhabda sublineata TaxID=1163346 RepID=UPI0024E0BFB1|nr:zinc finger protein OZF-like [Diorhabda sublineata]
MEEVSNIRLNVGKFTKICRICLSESHVIPLENNSVDILKTIVNIQIDLNDGLPQQICLTCSAKLKDISTFVESIKTNDVYLKKIIELSIKQDASENFNYNTSYEFCENDSTIETKSLKLNNKITQQVESNEKNNRRLRKTVLHECKMCLKMFKHSPNLRRHINIVHKGIKPFKCEVCSKEFATFSRITEHIRIHTGERPYVCNYCGSSFKKYSTYYAHDMRHKIKNGERPKNEKSPKSYPRKREENPSELSCGVCLKVYSSKQALMVHMQIHSGEKTFLCTICGKEFMRKGHLQVHSRIHTGEKPYRCNDCGKTFRQPAAHRNHLLMHKNQRSYKCDLCNKSFIQSGHLQNHLKTHTGEKPYRCDFCGKEFAQNGNLRVHTRIHTNERPYKCPNCSLEFYDSSSLKKHKKIHDSISGKESQ